MKKQNLLLALFAGLALTVSSCNGENNSISSTTSSAEEPTNVWTGDVAAALKEVFGSSDVIPYLEAKDYVVEINYLQGTEIQYVDIYCSTSSVTLINDYGAILENDGWTYVGELDDGYHYQTKVLSELATQIVAYAYYEGTFNIFTYRDEIPDTSAYAAEWPAEVKTMINNVLGEGNPLPGIKAETITSTETTVDDFFESEENTSYPAISINCSYDRDSMETEYATLLELTGYVIDTTTTYPLKGVEYTAALGRISLSAYQYVFFALNFEGYFNIISFVVETAETSETFPTEFLNECFASIATDAIPAVEATSYKYYVTTMEGASYVVVEVFNDTDPFANYATALTTAGFTYDAENDVYILTTTEGHMIGLYFEYDAETKHGSIILFAQYGVTGTSTSYPANSFNSWLGQMVGLQVNAELFAFEASSYTYDVAENASNGAYDFVVVGTVEEDITEAYAAQLVELGFAYEETYDEYAAAIYTDGTNYLYLWIKLAYNADAGTFTVTYSLSIQ